LVLVLASIELTILQKMGYLSVSFPAAQLAQKSQGLYRPL
jgi:hypothetical protein